MAQQAKESPIKYITIEMIKKDEKNLIAKSIHAGLFKGIRFEQLDQTEGAQPDVFMLMQVKDKTLLALGVKYYNILSLEAFDGTTKIITYFRASDEEQEKAFDMSATLVNELNAAGRTVEDDAKIIDISTYTDIPAVIEVSETSTKSTAMGRKTASHTLHQSTHTTHKPKEKKPSVIKRTTKKPSKAMLDKMTETIKAIADGTLELELPAIEKDTEDEKKRATTTVDDEYNSDYFMCG